MSKYTYVIYGIVVFVGSIIINLAESSDKQTASNWSSRGGSGYSGGYGGGYGGGGHK